MIHFFLCVIAHACKIANFLYFLLNGISFCVFHLFSNWKSESNCSHSYCQENLLSATSMSTSNIISLLGISNYFINKRLYQIKPLSNKALYHYYYFWLWQGKYFLFNFLRYHEKLEYSIFVSKHYYRTVAQK